MWLLLLSSPVVFFGELMIVLDEKGHSKTFYRETFVSHRLDFEIFRNFNF